MLLFFQMLIVHGTPNEIQQIEEKVETIKTDLQSKSIDDPHIQRLWVEIFDYRQDLIKQNTTVNIMEQIPAYSNPSMVTKKKTHNFRSQSLFLDIDRYWTIIRCKFGKFRQRKNSVTFE